MDKAEEEVSQEPEVVEKIVEVEKPLALADKSPEELEKLQSDIESQKIQNHLADEEAKIKAMACPLCGRKLGLKPEKYMKTGNLPEEIECKKCEKLLTVSVIYKDDPETSTAEITIKPGNYAWEVKLPSQWTDKHVIRWAEEEMAKLSANRTSLSINEQKLLRVLYLGLKKQKLVK